ncbi:alcohol dehydrogenase catalytic domain-containing protein [Anaerovorax odorimutans]|uniref:Alcohol dehydrogenase catalytic domain-containing protein n=1 Tax=Anaerovorax odorimutans TaxID=109327 RepID=A0ABT1RNT3_9FIRM|nr:alcohol dehydrogenase catalytic domain-containing protein [Anaerovorax odorimutans]MCQ4636819.1 alcohol dehydrogenase catalytic domain-containing protein [Anaerovorax odorimutans]
MRAVVKFKDGKDGWEIRDIERITPKDNEVEIKVMATGICGSELHLYHDNHTYAPPVVVGHEFCGEIVRVGKDVTKWKIGDRVVSENNKSVCGVCEFCRTGRPILCPERKPVGYKVNGGWTSYFCTPEHLLIKIPDNVSFNEAAMTEPVSVATQAQIVRNTVKIGDVVLVQGCGTIGLINAMVAKAIGAQKVILTGTNVDEQMRLPIARKLNIDRIVNVEKENLKKIVMEETDRMGVDVIVEASGADPAIYGMVELLKKTGNIVAIGETARPDLQFPWVGAVFKSCTITYSFGATYEAWQLALNLMGQGKLHLNELITHEIPLEEFRKGFELLEKKEALKVIMHASDY